MAGWKDGERQFGKLSWVNHWLTVLTIPVMWILGFAFHEMERGPAKSSLVLLHVSIGICLVPFLLWRVGWRLRWGFPKGVSLASLKAKFARLVHWALPLNILVLAVTGPLIVWSAGRPIRPFDLFGIPSPLAENHELHEALEGIHAIAAKPVLIILIGLHIVGILIALAGRLNPAEASMVAVPQDDSSSSDR